MRRTEKPYHLWNAKPRPNRGHGKPVKPNGRLQRQADALFGALIANPELFEQDRAYELRVGISPVLGVVLLADKHGGRADVLLPTRLSSMIEIDRFWSTPGAGTET